MMNSKRFDLMALASIPLLMTLGNSMLIPVLPVLENKLNISQLQSSLIITIYSIAAILLIPIAGYFSDRYGRKKVIVPSLIVTAIGGAVAAFAAWKIADSYEWIMIGRLIQGIGASGAFPVVLPTVSDMFNEESDVSKGLGIIETANTFGKVLSPIIGAILASVIWCLPFVVVPIFSLISLCLVSFFVKVPKQTHENKPRFKTFIKNLKSTFKKKGRWLIAIFCIGILNMFVLFGYQFHFSHLLETGYEIGGSLKGLILAIPLFILCIASYISSKIIGDNKQLMKWFIFTGNVVCAIFLFFISKDTGIVGVTSLLSLASFGIGLSLPSLDTLITEGVDKKIRGSITSIYSSMRFVGVAIGPPIVALMLENIRVLSLILAILSGLAAMIGLLAIKPK